MKRNTALFLLSIFSLSVCYAESSCSLSLFDELELVEQINEEIYDKLPFFYNFSMIGGYFNTPSASMPPTGALGMGAARVTPYNLYGVSLQTFARLELSANYRVYKGIIDPNFGARGFGDEAERIGNIKIGVIAPEDGMGAMPSFSVGADDFFGTSRFNSQYGVLTKQWKRYNLEASLGWGNGRIKGFFGGIAWSPWRKSNVWFFKNLSLLAEWDAFNYKHHPHEHPEGREVKSRINAGIAFVGWDMLQFSITSLRGTTIAGGASFRYPIGTTEGIFPKTKDPALYSAPVDLEPLGVTRPDKRFAQELAYAFSDQGLDLYSAYLTEVGEKKLWLKVVNNRYREESVVRKRIHDLLSAITPSDIKTITVVIEADAFPLQQYVFRYEDLQRYRLGLIGEKEFNVISPMKEAKSHPKHATQIFHRNKRIWEFTIRPRLLTFFGGATGKFKYNIGLVAALDGYLLNQFYYKLQVGYSIHSTMWSIQDMDTLNPSQLLNVRTDTIRYFQNNSVSFEQAYIQKGINIGKGWFYRLATGYFEPAYGGVASEFLLYPVQANWAIGIEGAGVLKRHYHGIDYTTKIRKLNGRTPTYVHFIGYQYFLDLYYQFKPLDLDFKVKIGSFLARDKGARFEVGKTFPNGFRFSLWYTLTNAGDKLNGSTYHDKGFAFYFPLDFFLPQSSRTYLGYAMSAWLRDCGASAATGKPLMDTLYEERYNSPELDDW